MGFTGDNESNIIVFGGGDSRVITTFDGLFFPVTTVWDQDVPQASEAVVDIPLPFNAVLTDIQVTLSVNSSNNVTTYTWREDASDLTDAVVTFAGMQTGVIVVTGLSNVGTKGEQWAIEYNHVNDVGTITWQGHFSTFRNVSF